MYVSHGNSSSTNEGDSDHVMMGPKVCMWMCFVGSGTSSQRWDHVSGFGGETCELRGQSRGATVVRVLRIWGRSGASSETCLALPWRAETEI